jgi:hypothetical protein
MNGTSFTFEVQFQGGLLVAGQIRFPPEGLAIMVQFRSRWRTFGSVQLAKSVLYNPLFGVKGTERSWNAEDIKGNPTEYAHHTIGKLANCAAFREKGPIGKPRLSHITNYQF